MSHRYRFPYTSNTRVLWTLASTHIHVRRIDAREPQGRQCLSVLPRAPMSDIYPCRPIAYLRSPYAQRIDAPHQPTVVQGTETGDAAQARVEFVDDLPGEAFADLAGFERIWLIFAFDRSQGWKAQVKPPRGGPKRGVLATRSPHRPNPLGLSAVELVAVEARALVVRGVDLLDGTPVLDIKPYVPYADAFAQSRAGWIDEIDASQGRHSAPGPKRPRKAKAGPGD
ncbi:tRNA (N6-threonylcarbamoyladenosine(37)-N6)-methyltransferase TrmO [Lysobacter gummosus]|uniref:tRNA (N6-threonylcarbamoyladenosine(37)-N6)-methyltransferase TrmO n=2 Tax=Lysobacter gummosus TaxID=262324 RepID=UPI003642C8BF